MSVLQHNHCQRIAQPIATAVAKTNPRQLAPPKKPAIYFAGAVSKPSK